MFDSGRKLIREHVLLEDCLMSNQYCAEKMVRICNGVTLHSSWQCSPTWCWYLLIELLSSERACIFAKQNITKPSQRCKEETEISDNAHKYTHLTYTCTQHLLQIKWQIHTHTHIQSNPLEHLWLIFVQISMLKREGRNVTLEYNAHGNERGSPNGARVSFVKRNTPGHQKRSN